MSPSPLKGFSVANEIVLIGVLSLRTRSKIYSPDHSQIMMTRSSTLTCWCHWKNGLVPLIPAKWDILNMVIHSDQNRTYESGCLLVPLMSSMRWPLELFEGLVLRVRLQVGFLHRFFAWQDSILVAAVDLPLTPSLVSWKSSFSELLSDFLSAGLWNTDFRYFSFISFLAFDSCQGQEDSHVRRPGCFPASFLPFRHNSSKLLKNMKEHNKRHELLCQILSFAFEDDSQIRQSLFFEFWSSLDRREDMRTSLAWALEYREQLSSMQNLFVAVQN